MITTIDIDFVFDFLFINIKMHSTCYFSFSYKYIRMNKLNITENFILKCIIYMYFNCILKATFISKTSPSSDRLTKTK